MPHDVATRMPARTLCYRCRVAAAPTVLALDFDGVLCDGRREYFETAWRAYTRCWSPAALSAERRQWLAREFSSLRPLIESGWEFPLLIHALVSGAPIPAPDGREA